VKAYIQQELLSKFASVASHFDEHHVQTILGTLLLNGILIASFVSHIFGLLAS